MLLKSQTRILGYALATLLFVAAPLNAQDACRGVTRVFLSESYSLPDPTDVKALARAISSADSEVERKINDLIKDFKTGNERCPDYPDCVPSLFSSTTSSSSVENISIFGFPLPALLVNGDIERVIRNSKVTSDDTCSDKSGWVEGEVSVRYTESPGVGALQELYAAIAADAQSKAREFCGPNCAVENVIPHIVELDIDVEYSWVVIPTAGTVTAKYKALVDCQGKSEDGDEQWGVYSMITLKVECKRYGGERCGDGRLERWLGEECERPGDVCDIIPAPIEGGGCAMQMIFCNADCKCPNDTVPMCVITPASADATVESGSHSDTSDDGDGQGVSTPL